MRREELWQFNCGRFSTSIAKYGDGSGVHVRRLGNYRIGIDIGLYRLRLEWY